MIYTPYKSFSAAVYSQDAYSSGSYQEVQGTSTGSTSPLANTGYDVIVPVALGASIIIASVILLVKRLRTKKQA